MLNQSVYYSGDASKDFVREMQKNYLDFSAFLSTYVKDEHGNPYSLSNYLKIFNVDFDGKPHDALADALNLMDLYKAMLANPDIMKEEYKKVLARMRHLPTPIAQVVSELNDGKTVGRQGYLGNRREGRPQMTVQVIPTAKLIRSERKAEAETQKSPVRLTAAWALKRISTTPMPTIWKKAWRSFTSAPPLSMSSKSITPTGPK
jgi:DNA polymerase III epsilon subunit-like protein